MKILLPLLLILCSCATSTPDYSNKNFRKGAAEDDVKLEEDYKWIDQLNFDKKVEAKYQADKDEFNLTSEETSHALVKESLHNLSVLKLDETLAKAEDALTKINIKCYQSKFEEALKIADDIYGQYKNNTSYWNQLGTCYYLKNDFAKAILFYNKSRDLDSKFAPPVNNLGVVYNKLGKYQKALAAFKKALDMSAFSITPSYNLAQIYLRFGTVGKALSIFQGLQKKSPKDVEVNSALASAYLLKNETQSALDIYNNMDKESLTKMSIGVNYVLALKLANHPAEAQTAFSSLGSTTNIDLKEYAQHVEKFIRN